MDNVSDVIFSGTNAMPCTTPAQPEDEGEVELNIKEEQGCKRYLSSFQMKLVIIGLELDGVAACTLQ